MIEFTKEEFRSLGPRVQNKSVLKIFPGDIIMIARFMFVMIISNEVSDLTLPPIFPTLLIAKTRKLTWISGSKISSDIFEINYELLTFRQQSNRKKK